MVCHPSYVVIEGIMREGWEAFTSPHRPQTRQQEGRMKIFKIVKRNKREWLGINIKMRGLEKRRDSSQLIGRAPEQRKNRVDSLE